MTYPMLGGIMGKTIGSGGGGSLPPLIINVPADFPTTEEANTNVGRHYIIGTNVTDNDPTKTNTGQSFVAGQDIIWNPGTNLYVLMGEEVLWEQSTEAKLKVDTPINLQASGLKDDDVTTPIRLGGTGDTALATTKQNLVGAINEVLASIPASLWINAGNTYEPVVANVNVGIDEDQAYLILKPSTILDQQQTGGSNQTTFTDVYQTITAGATGLLTQIDVNLLVSHTADFNVYIYEGSGTGGTLLSSLTGLTLGTGWQSINLITLPRIDAGNTYTLRFTSATQLRLRFNLAGGYSGGFFSVNPSADLTFRTYVNGTFFEARKDGLFFGVDAEIDCHNDSTTSALEIKNSATGQIVELGFNEGSDKFIGFSNNPNETTDLDKKGWSIEAIKQHIPSGSGPLFVAELSTTQSGVTGDGSGYTPIFDNVIIDNGGDYNNTTGVFTAPAAGPYLFNLILHLDSLTAAHDGGFVLFNATTNSKRVLELNFGGIRSLASGRDRLNITWISNMDLGETASISFNVSGSTKTVNLRSDTPDRIPQWAGFQINAGGGGPSGSMVHDQFVITSDDTTSFTLSNSPYEPDEVIFTVNGVTSYYGIGEDFTVSGTTLTWNKKDGVEINIGHKVQAWYWTGPTGLAQTSHEKLVISSDGQVNFTLASAPTEPTKAILVLNGVTSYYGSSEDFDITGTTLNWKNNNGVTLKTGYKFQIWYW